MRVFELCGVAGFSPQVDWQTGHGWHGVVPNMQHIGHETTMTGAEFDYLRVVRLPCNFIHMCQIKAAHFAKQARYSGAKGKVTGGADGILPPVISMFRMAKHNLDKLADW